MRCIRIDAEGDATLEELEDAERQDNGQEPSKEPEKTKSSNKKVYMLQTHFLFCLSHYQVRIHFGQFIIYALLQGLGANET